MFFFHLCSNEISRLWTLSLILKAWSNCATNHETLVLQKTRVRNIFHGNHMNFSFCIYLDKFDPPPKKKSIKIFRIIKIRKVCEVCYSTYCSLYLKNLFKILNYNREYLTVIKKVFNKNLSNNFYRNFIRIFDLKEWTCTTFVLLLSRERYYFFTFLGQTDNFSFQILEINICFVL